MRVILQRFRSARNTTRISCSLAHVRGLDTTCLRRRRRLCCLGSRECHSQSQGFYHAEHNTKHVTLARVKALSPSFAILSVLYHGEWAGRQYLVLSKLRGQTLTNIWPTLDEATKCRYVDRVVDVCNELGKLEADHIGGLDGNQLLDPLLIKIADEWMTWWSGE